MIYITWEKNVIQTPLSLRDKCNLLQYIIIPRDTPHILFFSQGIIYILL